MIDSIEGMTYDGLFGGSHWKDEVALKSIWHIQTESLHNFIYCLIDTCVVQENSIRFDGKRFVKVKAKYVR